MKHATSCNGLPSHMSNAKHHARRLKRRTQNATNATSADERGIGLKNVHMKM